MLPQRLSVPKYVCDPFCDQCEDKALISTPPPKSITLLIFAKFHAVYMENSGEKKRKEKTLGAQKVCACLCLLLFLAGNLSE